VSSINIDTSKMNNKKIAISIRQVSKADSAAIVALDAEITGADKSAYLPGPISGCSATSW
jgi:hypothetical protein